MSIAPETALEIVQLVAEGKSFRKISKMDEMPSRSTIQRAYNDDGEFRLLVDNARRARLPKASEGPTIERQRKGDIIWEACDRSLRGEVTQQRARATVTSRLDWYFDRQAITADMHAAGERMAKIMFHAGKHPRVCVMFRERTDGLRGDNADILNEKSDAQVQLEKAIDKLDADEIDAIWDVCALDNFCGNVNALRTGLRALVVHFRIMSDRGHMS